VHAPDLKKLENEYGICNRCRKAETARKKQKSPIVLDQPRSDSATNLDVQLLEALLDAYTIPHTPIKLCFLYDRNSHCGCNPSPGVRPTLVRFVEMFKSKVYIDSGEKVIAGEGPTVIVPDYYYKVSQQIHLLNLNCRQIRRQ
jgi:hypothetical protein